MALSVAISSNTQRYVRTILGVFSAVSGLIFMSLSSFFKLQFDHTKTSEILFFGILSALIVFLVFMAPNWTDVLRNVCSLNFSSKLAVECVFMGIVWILAFLIKYPRFDVHSSYRRSCVVEDNGNGMSRGSQYSLFSVGAFALLALLLSSERQKALELGFFSILIGLIMDTSMEIPTTRDGPNLWYILGSVVYCVWLIFLKHYIESLMGNGDDYIVLPDKLKLYKRGSFKEGHRIGLVFCSALVGIVCLFLSPFSEQQFEDSPNFKGVCFITLSLLLGFFLLKAREFIDVLVIKCHERYLVKAAVKISLLMVVSMVIFITKYPRFKIQSKHRESCRETNGKRVMSQRNQFDVFSTGSFSLFALIMSCGKERPVKLGIFSFLLEMTMDTSIEILGNEGPYFFYVLFASLYCASLILVKSYLDSLITIKDNSDWQHDQQEVSIDTNANERSLEDEKPLIESDETEEQERETSEDIEIGIDDIDNTEVKDSGDDEPSVRDVYSGWSHFEDGSKLLNHKQRHIIKRRERAKRDKERVKKWRKNQKDDMWIS